MFSLNQMKIQLQLPLTDRFTRHATSVGRTRGIDNGRICICICRDKAGKDKTGCQDKTKCKMKIFLYKNILTDLEVREFIFSSVRNLKRLTLPK